MNSGYSDTAAAHDPDSASSILPQRVVLDTCVLMSTILKNLLLRLAQSGMFEPVWADYIGQEWRRNASRVWEVSEEDITTQWQDMQLAFPRADMGIVTEFEKGLNKSDPKDWHVIAAGRAALARYPGQSVCILTRNLRDFNRSELRQLGLSLSDPDAFLAKCYELNADLLMQLLAMIPDDAITIGRPREPLETVLRRERLFRLNNLIAQDENAAA
ncbi:PIN domain-containing protein [Advenella mimigardefordensis]|nr:PIN domain-containing protein [Advenella mimigardefordensis]